MKRCITASPSISQIALLLSTVVVLANCPALCFGQSEDDVAQTVASWCPNAFFNFGDSLSDTGNAVLTGGSVAEKPPYGEAFFGKPSGRCSNGRLVIDFLLLSFSLPLLEPHLQASAIDSVQGLNFAFSGATAAHDYVWHQYNLYYQVDEFVRVKNLVVGSQPQQFIAEKLNQVDQTTFESALYTICIGGNDIMASMSYGLQPEAIVRDVGPNIVYEIVTAVRTLYSQGARKFMIFNGPPLGCSSKILTDLDGSVFPIDDLGCLENVDAINLALNKEYFKAVQSLRASLPNVSITYFDYYAANVEILQNPFKYGFIPDLTKTACCGAPGVGTLNFNPSITCGSRGSHKCAHPDRYVLWDGVHFTEAFYRQIAKFILNGDFSDPPTNFTRACNLTFENFGHTRYEDVFPTGSVLSSDE